MNEVGVARAILVPPRIEGGRNDLSLDAATAHPDRFAVMGKLDQDAPDAREKLASWRDHPGMLGLRFILQHTLQSTVQFLSAVRHDVYRGDALAVPRGLGVDHGPRALRVVGLEIS
jgi:predicted TIM-barrel fold metal-dependent hydrolase